MYGDVRDFVDMFGPFWIINPLSCVCSKFVSSNIHFNESFHGRYAWSLPHAFCGPQVQKLESHPFGWHELEVKEVDPGFEGSGYIRVTVSQCLLYIQESNS